MKIEIGEELLDFLCTALALKSKPAKMGSADRLFKKIATNGWASRSDLEEISEFLDPRLASFRFDTVELSTAIGIHWEAVYYRPKAKTTNVDGYDAIRAGDVAVFLFTLERIGFNTNASNLHALLFPPLKSRSKKMLSDAELEILWFERLRHKQPPIILYLKTGESAEEIRESLKTDSGYKAEIITDGYTRKIGLSVSAPKFRIQPRPVPTLCKDCGIEWRKGDPDSSAAHHKAHKNIMEYLDPKPNGHLLAEKIWNGEYANVTNQSRLWKHHEMYIRATAFKREMKFDFFQWGNPQYGPDENGEGFLFTDDDGRILGACAFRPRSAAEGIVKWGLQWVWICPAARRKGYLSRYWSYFRKKFGDFEIEAPLSDSMKLFVEKTEPA